MKGDLFEDIIRKNFEGTATAQEKRMLLNWLKEDAARQELFFYHLLKRETERPQHLPNPGGKISDYEMFLSGKMSKTQILHFPESNPQRSRRRYTLYAGWAAALILIFAIAGYIAKDTILYHTYYSHAEGVRALSLDDGTTVILNSNSVLKVPRYFPGDGTREVWIEGEAFFQVTRKPQPQKFVVYASDVAVEVLGTKFNVNSRGHETEVTLDEGKVKLISKTNKTIVMRPGEQVSVSSNGLTFNKKVVDVDRYTEWKSSKLSFEDTPLSEVAFIVGSYYGVSVTVEDSVLAKRQFSGTLPNDNLNLVLTAIATAYDIQIERNANGIQLRK